MNDPRQTAAAGHGRRRDSTSCRAGENESTDQLDMFAAADEGRRLRDDGMKAAEHAAHPWVRSAIDQAIRELIATGQPFTSDDVRAKAPPIGSPNLLGARINAAARRDEIARIGFVQTMRPEAHGRYISQWQAA
jgi:hypothetical protein